MALFSKRVRAEEKAACPLVVRNTQSRREKPDIGRGIDRAARLGGTMRNPSVRKPRRLPPALHRFPMVVSTPAEI
ncbi:MAG: hypothetical protein ACP5UT_07570 [Bryobacteraceae bacterium]